MNKKTKNEFDSIIIGFGKGGKTLAANLASRGQSVALVEKSDKMYGGTCINVGCIPSKSLVRSAAASAQDASSDFAAKRISYKKAIEEKRRLTSMLREKNYEKLNANERVKILNGTARFTSPFSVNISFATGADSVEIFAKNIYINTGAVPVIPNIPGIENNPFVYYSETLMDLEELPKKLIIIGGGYIGLEFASMYANFGSQVTVLQDGPTFLPREDNDVSHEIKQLLEAQGIVFRLGADIKGVSEEGIVAYKHQGTAYADRANAVLVATGRRSNTSNLNLRAANVSIDERGAIITDVNMQTTQKGIFAMGDVTGGLQFTYTSLDDYRVIASGLDGESYTADKRANVPYSVFMNTPFSRVGLNEKDAQKMGKNYRVAKLHAATIPKAQVLKKPIGLMKALIDTDTGKILGAMLLCEESYEVINIVKLAMDLDANYTVLRDQIFTHPTMSEALNDLFAL